MNLMEGEVDIENNILVSDISVKSVFTLYIFVFLYLKLFFRSATLQPFGDTETYTFNSQYIGKYRFSHSVCVLASFSKINCYIPLRFLFPVCLVSDTENNYNYWKVDTLHFMYFYTHLIGKYK